MSGLWVGVMASMGIGGESVTMALRPGSEDFADMWVSRGGLEARRHGEQASQVTKWGTDSVRRVTMGVHNLGKRQCIPA